MTKDKYSDTRWHSADLNQPDNPEQGLSQEEKAKRVNFLSDLHQSLFGKPLDDKELPDNLKPNKK